MASPRFPLAGLKPVRPAFVLAWTAFAFALIGASGGARAEPLRWSAPLADCYDSAHEEKRAVVIVFYNGAGSRAAAEAEMRALSLSPRMQALSGVTVWCRGDVAAEVVAANIGKALKVTAYPSISILRPEWAMLYEDSRIIPEGVPQAAIETVLDKAVRRVRAAVPPPWQPSKRY